MLPELETIDEFSIDSEIADTIVSVRLRRQANHKINRFNSGPYWLDLHAGSLHVPHYGVDEQFVNEAAARFLLKHVKGVAPLVH